MKAAVRARHISASSRLWKASAAWTSAAKIVEAADRVGIGALEHRIEVRKGLHIHEFVVNRFDLLFLC